MWRPTRTAVRRQVTDAAPGLVAGSGWHHQRVTVFDLLLRGGTVVDGTGSPSRRADVGVLGDRILAIDDLSAVDDRDVATVLDATGLVVAPGFIDPHGHSDGSLFVDGGLASHLRQGYTTQLSGNCGETLAPITDAGRELVALALRPNQLVARWRSFGEYLDAVAGEQLGFNVAFLVGQGTIRGSVMGAEAGAANDAERQAMVREVEVALDAGAFGLSSGLIYTPGIHAEADEIAALVTTAARRGGLYATHMRNEGAGLFTSLAESIATIRAARDGGAAGARLQVSHLKCGARAVWGRAPDALALLEAARDEDLDVAADQYPYTSAATTLTTILPPSLLALGVEECVAALGDHEARDRVAAEMSHGISGWENVTADPGWEGIRISFAASHPEWSGRSLAELGDTLDADPADLAMDALIDDQLDVSVVIDCMDETDVETIMAVPWIAVCTDAEGRRPGDPILDAGRPHPRTYGSTARVLGTYVRERETLALETAVAKLSAVPAARLGLRDRGVLREGVFADVVVFDPATIADDANYEQPSRHPTGIEHVVVNGRLAVLAGQETGERAGRLLRRAG